MQCNAMERCVCVPACVRISIWTVFIHVCIAVLAGANRTCIQKTFKWFCFGLDSRWAWNRRDSLIVTDKNSLWEFPNPWNETKSSVCLSHHVVILCIKPSKIASWKRYWGIHGRIESCEPCSMYHRSIASLRLRFESWFASLSGPVQCVFPVILQCANVCFGAFVVRRNLTTIHGRNPANHPTCMKPCEWWDIYHINWLAGFLCHHQYGINKQASCISFPQGCAQHMARLNMTPSFLPLPKAMVRCNIPRDSPCVSQADFLDQSDEQLVEPECGQGYG